MSKPTFYYLPESPPCRTVLLVARMLGIDLELKRVDLSKKEQLNPEFVKINPFHVVPTLVDSDEFVLWESRVIAAYLIQSRKPDSPLYPSGDLKKRVTIDKYLHYDLGTFYRAISDVVYSLFMTGKLDLSRLPRLNETLKTLDEAMAANRAEKDCAEYLAGGTEHLTLADISLYFTLTLADVVPEIDLEPYQNIVQWSKLVDQAVKPYNEDGLFDEARNNLKLYAEHHQKKALEEAEK